MPIHHSPKWQQRLYLPQPQVKRGRRDKTVERKACRHSSSYRQQAEALLYSEMKKILDKRIFSKY